MATKTVEVEIQGVSPLLMHKFPLEPIEALEKKPPREQAEHAAFRDPVSQELFIPGQSMQRALVSAANYSKGKGRGSLARSAAACILITPERLLLGVKEYEIDSRPVVVPATKGRVLRHRPRLDSWHARFEIEYDDNLLTETQCRRIVDDCGSRRPGGAWQGEAGFGRARRGLARRGSARTGMARRGRAWLVQAGRGRAGQGFLMGGDMRCIPFRQANHTRGFICGPGQPSVPKCGWCSFRSTKLCDFPMAHGSCDAAMCDRHATSAGKGIDHCPDHANPLLFEP